MNRWLAPVVAPPLLLTACRWAPAEKREGALQGDDAAVVVRERSGGVTITGADSNLPIELTSNGLGQECWALWDAASRKWR